MRLKIRPKKDDTQWHKWFAWCPVRIDDDHNIWLANCLRRRVWYGGYFSDIFYWEYKAMED